MTINGYYRHPTLHKNTIVFVCEDDLWEVPAKGGVARRLTANLGMVSRPALSPDGKLLAFVGREEGDSEVYVMPAAGGSATRLTWLGSMTSVLGWTPEGDKIIFASSAGQPFLRLTPLYAISPDGGQPEALPYGPAHAITFGPDGGVALGRRASDLARWKRYRGGSAGDIWIDTKGSGRFKQFLKRLKSNMVNPIWLEERLYFLSDHEGVGNLYSATPAGKDVQRHTHHQDYYARHLHTDGQRIVYQAGADLYLFDPAQDKSTKIRIDFHSPRVQRNRKFVKAANYMDHYTLHPKGHSAALTSRGKPFAMSNWEGAVIQYGESQGARYRLPEWLNDGQRLVMVSDATGEEVLEIHKDATQSPTDRGVEQLLNLNIGRPLFLRVSPTDDALVFGNHRYELVHIDLETRELKVLDRSHYGRIAGLDWSPDGKWVAYSFRTSMFTSAIKLCHVESGETHFVSQPQTYFDHSPSFDPAGKYLYFISYRDFDPVSDSHYFELSFPRGGRPYLVTLQKTLSNPFIPLPGEPPADEECEDDEEKDAGNDSDASEAKSDKKTAPQGEKKPVQIDVDGIRQRVAAFPVPESLYQQIAGVIKGKVLFTSFPIEGSLGRERWSDTRVGKGALEVYDLAQRKKEFLVSGVNEFDVSRDRNFFIYRSGKNLRVLKIGEKPDNNAGGHTKKSGWLDLNRLRVAVNPPGEWRQMFREAWRLQRDHFWTEDMSAVDWQLVYKRYLKLVDRVASRAEFSDLMWEMQGELGTSHAYELGGDYRPSPRYPQGFLGADFEYDPAAEGYRISHLVSGDSWNEREDSPLNRLGVEVQEGDILLAIDGRRLSETVSPEQLLVNRAGVEVQLTFGNSGEETDPSDEDTACQPTRTVLVKTLSNEKPARYREWVENNRHRVHQATEGRVGYVHVPDMGPAGFAEFHRYYLAESEREGLIIDVRFNGGGNVSQLLLEKLARRRISYKKPRYGQIRPYPYHSVLGPMVALTNEYAGSDGDIFCHAFKLMDLGPLIGKRTWGGVIGIWPRHSLVDGSFTTQPEFPSWFVDVGWGVENYGTDPDIEIDIKPQDYAQGKDPQLARAIKEIMSLMKENPPQLPEFGPPPSRALPELPKVKKKKKP